MILRRIPLVTTTMTGRRAASLSLLSSLLLGYAAFLCLDDGTSRRGRRRSLRALRAAPAPMLAARGPGPELVGLDGRSRRIADVPNDGVTWYRILSSPKFQWNAAPYHWNTCPAGEDLYLGSTGFSFREPHPLDPSRTRSKHLRFRVERRAERECEWNFSKACLAGGNFVMNFGKTARDMLHPGEHTLKTNDGAIRIVAYNSNWACSVRTSSSSIELDGSQISGGQDPIDYLRRVVPSTVDPDACEAWLNERSYRDDLFKYDSDFATVHVDAPWMQIVVQVRHNKVATAGSCVNGGMHVWIADMDPGLLGEEYEGLLGGDRTKQAPAGGRALRRGGDGVQEVEGGEHVVDGPFGR